jgi:hypothetical protein
VVANRAAARASGFPVLNDVGFDAARIRRNPEACQSIIPQEDAVFADRTDEGIDRLLGDPTRRHRSLSPVSGR